jgi:hypothetical protein
MNKRLIAQSLVVLSVCLLVLLTSSQLAFSNLGAHSYQTNDLFAAVNQGRVFWYDGSGVAQVFHDVMNTGQGGFTTGMAFDPSMNLYVTNFSTQTVAKFDDKGVLIDGHWWHTTTGQPEAVVRDANGDFYVSSAAGGGLLQKFGPGQDSPNLAGFPMDINPGNVGRGGVDWIDLAADNCTMFWTVEEQNVRMHDVCTNTGLGIFNLAPLPSSVAYALRILPDGRVLVANTSVVVLLNADGSQAATYDVTGEDSWFSLNLVQGCQEFWAGNFSTGKAYRFDVATGQGLDNHSEVLNTGVPPSFLFGLTIKGECLAIEELVVEFDIKPQSCPNPLNVKSGGRLPVAILGTDDFDVTDVDVSTVQLEGVDHVDHLLRDETEPVADRQDVCDCNEADPDGLTDLTLKFDKQAIVAALPGDPEDGDVVVLTITGQTLDGRDFTGQDCVVIVKRGNTQSGDVLPFNPTSITLFQNVPNPFKDGTMIHFSLPEMDHATLTVQDVAGRTVATLVDGVLDAGVHAAEWNDDAASGIYFYRLTAGSTTLTKKMILMK